MLPQHLSEAFFLHLQFRLGIAAAYMRHTAVTLLRWASFCPSLIVDNKKTPPFGSVFVVLPGFEPRQADPESDVLPLHHRTMSISDCGLRIIKFRFLYPEFSRNRLQKYKVFQYLQNFFAIFFVLCSLSVFCKSA